MSKIPAFHMNKIFGGPVRLLVKESHEIFTSKDADNKKNSMRYRSILQECIDKLSTDLTVDDSIRIEQMQMFKEIAIIWHLCEVLLMTGPQTGGDLVNQLSLWIKTHFDNLPQESKEILKSLESGNYQFREDSHIDGYWNLLTRLIMRGDTRKAVQLLSCHQQIRVNDQMQLVLRMLETIPSSNQYIIHEFYNKWFNWTSWCKRECETGQFDNNKHLLNIVRLLSQDITVYEELASHCESWYELFIAHLLYSDPCFKEPDTTELCHKIIQKFRQNHPKHKTRTSFATDDIYDEIIISALDYRLIGVIANSYAYFDDNWWFLTHFVDLLHRSKHDSLNDIPESDRLRESLLQDYASTLFEDDLLWPIGVSYLDECHVSGRFILEILISRMPLDIDDEAKANKLISISKRRNLDAARSVCLVMARKWLSHRNSRKTLDKLKPIELSNALYWAIKSGDPAMITHIADHYLHYYCKTGEFPDNSVLESLRRLPLDNERLAFVSKYYEFKQLDELCEDSTDIGNLFRALLASEIYPRFFIYQLIEDMRRLLDVEPPIISCPSKTMDLMRSVEEITNTDNSDKDVELRRKLVRNLSRASIGMNVYDD